MWDSLYALDKQIFVFFNQLLGDRFDAFWIFVTDLRHSFPIYILAIALIVLFKKKALAIRGVLLLLATVTTTFALTSLVKIYVRRIRPNNVPDLETLIRILEKPTNYSFFSGHAAFACSLATFTVLMLRSKFKLIYVFYIWALLICFSRIFVGVHYPSDILVGALVGSSVALLIYRVGVSKYE